MGLLEQLDPGHYRFERKFAISSMPPSQIGVFIRRHPSLFSKAYPNRYVNNIYFDTIDKSHYWDNVDGNSRRIKVRIRWYNKLFGRIIQPVLEFKIKNNLLGSKVCIPLKSFSIDEKFTIDKIRNRFSKIPVSNNLYHYLLSLDFSLINRYKRQYFESFDKQYRITLDSELKFFKPHQSANFKFHKAINNTSSVLELKYDEKYDEFANYVAGNFPFRMTKNSKYVLGVESSNS